MRTVASQKLLTRLTAISSFEGDGAEADHLPVVACHTAKSWAWDYIRGEE
jgi:hypothetical protein